MRGTWFGKVNFPQAQVHDLPYSQSRMQHQSEDGSIPEMVANCYEELLDFALVEIAGQMMPQVDVMPLGNYRIGYFLVLHITKEIVKCV